MIKLEDLKPGMALVGIEPSTVANVLTLIPLGEGSVQVVYKTPEGILKERLLSRADENNISLATSERSWSFDGDGEEFKLAVEAKRIQLAYLFDPMMAIHTSNLDPLPHQITAVYESILPRQPLRFLLADDPGAGKTIMAGLYIRELIMRADARRILIVAPGSLVPQWRDELYEKFGLRFSIFSPDLELATPSGNPFDDVDQLIVRLDQMSRNEEIQAKVCASRWDLVVFDEAHKLAAHFAGKELTRTERFKFAQKISTKTRHLLLMTATPHNGKEEDFQLFLSLLDSDRFSGRFRDGVHKVDVSDLMRRMVKEEMVKFDGTPLFPERRAYTVNYTLSAEEYVLYEAVTNYVKTEMGKADQLGGQRKGSVGFALTSLQRRLASSPEAIYESLKRRHKRLEERLKENRAKSKEQSDEAPDYEVEDEDDQEVTEREEREEKVVAEATAAQTVAELEAEILILESLEKQARALVESGSDRKWDELSRILQEDANMRDSNGRLRKLIIFSEHRDTLHYLHRKISGVLGNSDAIVTIHGGTSRDERRRLQNVFCLDPEVRVLVATDAAGEGVNLQAAHLMVNYDLPWNPNRLEQRFGRIHRIRQQEVCHLWNLVAKETREGDVYYRLLEKISTESNALAGRVFDILGEAFDEVSLKELLLEAIRYGDQPEVRARLTQKIEKALDPDHLREILERNALAQETMSQERLFAVKEEMEKAEARRLQPFFVRSFFLKAFESLGGIIHPREIGRYEITYVPPVIREFSKSRASINRRDPSPVLQRYERVCFTREAVQPLNLKNPIYAGLIHPGHPLMLTISGMVLDSNVNIMHQGTILIDPTDESDKPWLLYLITHEIKTGEGTLLSKRLQFIRIHEDGTSTFAGWAPHLDLAPLSPEDRSFLKDLLASQWLQTNQEGRALEMAATVLAPQHLEEVSKRQLAQVEITLTAVNDRLSKEIAYWTEQWMKLRERQNPGPEVRLNIENARRNIEELEGRLEARKKELQSMRHITSATPIVLGGALVIPGGLLKRMRGDSSEGKEVGFATDAAARYRIEQLALDVVRKVEEARGCRVVDVSDQKCGWDFTSYPPSVDGKQPDARHIEVKGRVKGATTITVTRNEILYAFNQEDKFVLAIVLVDEKGAIEGPYYLSNPFDSEPGWGVSSVNYDLESLLAKGTIAR